MRVAGVQGAEVDHRRHAGFPADPRQPDGEVVAEPVDVVVGPLRDDRLHGQARPPRELPREQAVDERGVGRDLVPCIFRAAIVGAARPRLPARPRPGPPSRARAARASRRRRPATREGRPRRGARRSRRTNRRRELAHPRGRGAADRGLVDPGLVPGWRRDPGDARPGEALHPGRMARIRVDRVDRGPHPRADPPVVPDRLSVGVSGGPLGGSHGRGAVAAVPVDDEDPAEALAVQRLEEVAHDGEVRLGAEARAARVGREPRRQPVREHGEDGNPAAPPPPPRAARRGSSRWRARGRRAARSTRAAGRPGRRARGAPRAASR